MLKLAHNVCIAPTTGVLTLPPALSRPVTPCNGEKLPPEAIFIPVFKACAVPPVAILTVEFQASPAVPLTGFLAIALNALTTLALYCIAFCSSSADSGAYSMDPKCLMPNLFSEKTAPRVACAKASLILDAPIDKSLIIRSLGSDIHNPVFMPPSIFPLSPFFFVLLMIGLSSIASD